MELIGVDNNTITHEPLLEQRAALLSRFNVETLEKLHISGNERLERAQKARNSMGKNSHDFEYIHQMFEGLFKELIENMEALEHAPSDLPERDLIMLYNTANPAGFLLDRKNQYDLEPHITTERRGDLDRVLSIMADCLGLYSLQFPASPKGSSRG